MRDCLPSCGRRVRVIGAAVPSARVRRGGGSVTAEAFGSLERDVGGARGVAARDGGQALHVRAEQLGEGAGLRLAQLRELGGHVRDRAVVLAQLDAPVPARADLADLCGVAPGGQHAGQRGHPLLRRPPADLRGGRPEQLVDALAGETANGRSPAVLGEEAQRGDGQVVVAVPEPGPARVGEQVLPRRSAAAAGPARGASRTSASPASSSASRCRRTAGADSASSDATAGGGARSLLHQQPGDRPSGCRPRTRLHAVGRRPTPASGAGSAAGRPAFHNTSVTYIRVIGKTALLFSGLRVSGVTVGPARYPSSMSRAGLGTPPPGGRTPAPPPPGSGRSCRSPVPPEPGPCPTPPASRAGSGSPAR